MGDFEVVFEGTVHHISTLSIHMQWQGRVWQNRSVCVACSLQVATGAAEHLLPGKQEETDPTGPPGGLL